MAVQAQYPSNGFYIDFQIQRAPDDVTTKDDRQAINLAGRYDVNLGVGLTCNAAGSSKKRRLRDDTTTDLFLTNFLQSKLPPPATPTLIHLHNSEIENLIRLHNDKVGSEIEELQKIHLRKVLSLVQRKIKETLKEKNVELDMARKKNAELEANMSKVTAENQIWFNFARNRESVARDLKANLDRVLRQVPGDRHVEDDAESCSDRPRGNPKCRACRGRDVSVLMLPCRHLCLCKECEPEADTCPICEAKKNGSVQVFM